MSLPHQPYNFFLLGRHALSVLRNTIEVKRKLFVEEIGEQIELTPEQLALFYRCGCHLLESKKYFEATHVFLLLTCLNRKQVDIWLGLGMSLQQLHEYDSAIDAYELAISCDLENPVGYFYMAKCLFAMHDHGAALEAIEIAISYAEDRDEYRDLYIQAVQARESLERRL